MLVVLDSGRLLGELLPLTIGNGADDTSHLTIVDKGIKKRAAFPGRLARKALRSYLLRWRETQPVPIHSSYRSRATALGRAAA